MNDDPAQKPDPAARAEQPTDRDEQPFDAVAAVAELEAAMAAADARGGDSAAEGTARYIETLENDVLELNDLLEAKEAQIAQANARTEDAQQEVEQAKARLGRDADRRVAAFIRIQRESWGGGTYAARETPALALLGHPLVFWADGSASEPVEIVRADPQLRVEARGDELVLRMSPQPWEDSATVVVREGTARLLVYSFDSRQRQLARFLGEGLSVPQEAQDRVGRVLGSVSSVIALRSDVEHTGARAIERPPDPRIYAQLWRRGHGLRLRLSVYPLGRSGPGMEPGDGAARVTATVDGEPVATARDLDRERDNLDAVARACPALQVACRNGRDYHVADLEDCLALPLELGDQPDVCIEWPAGNKLTVTGPRGGQDGRLPVRAPRELYLPDDEAERFNRIDAAPELAAELTRALREHRMAAPEKPPARQPEPLDRSDLEHLRALGYAE